MSWFSNLKIKYKVLLMLVCVVLFVCAAGYSSYHYMQLMYQSAVKLSQNADQAKILIADMHSDLETATMILFTIGMLVIVCTCSISFFIAKSVIKPVKHLEALMVQVGEGNLAVYDKDVAQDEIGELVKYFNKMVEHQAKMVGMVKKTAEELSAASQEMAASSEEITATTTQVAQNMQNLAQEVDNGNSAVVETSKALLELSSLVQIARKKATSGAGNAKLSMQAAQDGQQTVEETVKRMDKIKVKTMETEDVIEMLNQYSEQIGSITDTITSIANQTNLLALNAAIEAARAGEVGRGFAVVAEEVRKLAEQSSVGAGEVAALVNKIAQDTKKAVKAMQENRMEVDQGVLVVNKAGVALTNILNAVDSTNEEIVGILQVADEEVATSDKIVNLISVLGNVIETTDNHAQEVAASAEETLAVMETLANSAQSASNMADELSEEVKIFQVS